MPPSEKKAKTGTAEVAADPEEKLPRLGTVEVSAFEFSNLAESTEAAYTKHRFAGFQNREAAQWRNWTVGDNQQPTFKQLEKGVTSMLEEMPESQRRTEGWSEHLTGGSSNFIFGEVELA